MTDPLFPLVARVATGGLFLAAAAHKLAQRRRFAGVLEGYKVLGHAAPALAVLTPVMEALAGAGACAPVAVVREIGLGICIALLVAYAALVAWALRRGDREIDCGCLGFSAKRPRIRPAMVGRNLGLSVFALIGFAPADPRPFVWLDGVGLVGAGLTLVLLYVFLDQLIALPARNPT